VPRVASSAAIKQGRSGGRERAGNLQHIGPPSASGGRLGNGALVGMVPGLSHRAEPKGRVFQLQAKPHQALLQTAGRGKEPPRTAVGLGFKTGPGRCIECPGPIQWGSPFGLSADLRRTQPQGPLGSTQGPGRSRVKVHRCKRGVGGWRVELQTKNKMLLVSWVRPGQSRLNRVLRSSEARIPERNPGAFPNNLAKLPNALILALNKLHRFRSQRKINRGEAVGDQLTVVQGRPADQHRGPSITSSSGYGLSSALVASIPAGENSDPR